MATIETYTGKHFNFLEPKEEDVDIKDIAFSLANQCRFNGHVPFFSVAEHSVAVAARLSPRLQLAGLLHDAAEAYLSDIPSPIKQYLPDYCAMEDKLQAAINARFGIKLSPEDKAEIKAADKDATSNEAFYLLSSKGALWSSVFFKPNERFQPRCVPPPEAVQMFLHWFYSLNGGKNGEPTLAERMGLTV